MKKIVLAYSGGLDTSYCAVYLSKTLGYEVHAITVNTGGFDAEEIAAIEKRAYELGVSSFTCIDAVATYYNTCIKYLIFGNVLKNNTYPLSVSAERTIQATEIAKKANEYHAQAIAHGSTGAGNDQVRFDVIFNVLCPSLEIITPIRDMKISRQEEISFLHDNGVQIDFNKALYSVNKGLWGTSVGGKETLTSHLTLPETAYTYQLKATYHESKDLKLEFHKGELVSVNDVSYSTAVAAIQAVEQETQHFAIGRDIHVGDTIIGIKGRVGFEAGAAVIIIKAHHLLEKHTLSKNQQIMKNNLSEWYGTWLHEANMLDPVMRNIEKFLEDSQKNVTGTVFLKLHPYRFELVGIISKNDLMTSGFGTYGEMNNGWSGDDVKGYAKVLSNALTIHHQVNASTHD